MKVTADTFAGFTATITPLPNPWFLQLLDQDLAYSQELYILAFEIGAPFFRKHFARFLSTRPIWLAADARCTQTLRELLTEFPHLHAAVWASNAQLHSKLIAIPSQGITYLGSHNLTQYSVGLSNNITLRIDSAPFAAHMQWVVQDHRRRGMNLTPLAPDELPPH
jgi:phosphatidylserine/phosphatidylglycerophosphate/cardiolipin synthase-like enzyme